jgi:hypothetical protein
MPELNSPASYIDPNIVAVIDAQEETVEETEKTHNSFQITVE